MFALTSRNFQNVALCHERGGDFQAREKGGFVRDTEEEHEDAQGNVYNKKTYEDLKRQVALLLILILTMRVGCGHKFSSSP